MGTYQPPPEECITNGCTALLGLTRRSYAWSPQIPLAVSPDPSDECHNHNPVTEKAMISDSIESSATPEPGTAQQKGKSKGTKKTKPTKKAARAKKAAGTPKAGRANKKAEVIALLKRAKGTTLAEIMKATGWQAHTVRGFVSILGSKGGEKIESSKSADGERTYKIK